MKSSQLTNADLSEEEWMPLKHAVGNNLAQNLWRETPRMPSKEAIQRNGPQDAIVGGFLGVMRAQREQ